MGEQARRRDKPSANAWRQRLETTEPRMVNKQDFRIHARLLTFLNLPPAVKFRTHHKNECTEHAVKSD